MDTQWLKCNRTQWNAVAPTSNFALKLLWIKLGRTDGQTVRIGSLCAEINASMAAAFLASMQTEHNKVRRSRPNAFDIARK